MSGNGSDRKRDKPDDVDTPPVSKKQLQEAQAFEQAFDGKMMELTKLLKTFPPEADPNLWQIQEDMFTLAGYMVKITKPVKLEATKEKSKSTIIDFLRLILGKLKTGTLQDYIPTTTDKFWEKEASELQDKLQRQIEANNTLGNDLRLAWDENKTKVTELDQKIASDTSTIQKLEADLMKANVEIQNLQSIVQQGEASSKSLLSQSQREVESLTSQIETLTQQLSTASTVNNNMDFTSSMISQEAFPELSSTSLSSLNTLFYSQGGPRPTPPTQRPTQRPTPQPKQASKITPKIQRWIENLRTTRDPETYIHIIFGDNPILENIEQLKTKIYTAAKETCKCQPTNCKCQEIVKSLQTRAAPGHKPVIAMISKNVREFRRKLEKTIINDLKLTLIDLYNRKWPELIPGEAKIDDTDKPEKELKFFVKQIPVEAENIKDELEQQLPKLNQVVRILRRDGTPTTTIWATIEDNPDNRKRLEDAAKKGVYVRNWRRPLELEQRNDVTQCSKCQQFGHDFRKCRNPTPKCRICSMEHFTRDHIKTDGEEYKCINCGNNHQANSRKCKKLLEAEKLQLAKKESNPARNRTITTTKPTQGNKRSNTKECFVCRKPGHIAKNCPEKQDQRNQPNNTQQPSLNQRPRGGKNRAQHNTDNRNQGTDMYNLLTSFLSAAGGPDYYKNNLSSWADVTRKNSTNHRGRANNNNNNRNQNPTTTNSNRSSWKRR